MRLRFTRHKPRCTNHCATQTLTNTISELLKSKIFLGGHAPRPPSRLANRTCTPLPSILDPPLDLKDYISRCDVCLAYQNAPHRETLMQHEIIARPWAKVGADLCDFRGRTLLVVCDYFSGFIEAERLQSTTTAAVSKALFARYGVLVTDNGPQFASAEFVSFAGRWGFQHVTSSPHYPQSNGRADNAVKTIKRLFTKSQETRQSEFQALLDWRNTPTEGLGSSPAQRFLGRRCRTLLPMTETLLTPAYNTTTDARALVVVSICNVW